LEARDLVFQFPPERAGRFQNARPQEFSDEL